MLSLDILRVVISEVRYLSTIVERHTPIFFARNSRLQKRASEVSAVPRVSSCLLSSLPHPDIILGESWDLGESLALLSLHFHIPTPLLSDIYRRGDVN